MSVQISTFRTTDAPVGVLGAARLLMDVAFEGDYEDDDWDHGLGGWHVVAQDDEGRLIAHASVVERTIRADGVPFRTGYVESVATEPELQGTGVGTQVMERIGEIIRRGFELGVLGTGELHFYERLGWTRWQGETSVQRADGLERTPDDDGYVMVLRFGPSVDLTLDGPITCEERPGDDW